MPARPSWVRRNIRRRKIKALKIRTLNRTKDPSTKIRF